MTSQELKEKLTVDDIIKLCCFLQGSDEVLYYGLNPIFCSCLDHKNGDSFKLYYYVETKLFRCYTGDNESYDIFELVRRAKEFDTFIESFNFVKKFFKIQDKYNHEEEVKLIDDWDIFQQIDDYDKKAEEVYSIEPIQENLLEYFYPLASPEEWLKDGINSAVMKHYEIRIDSALQKIIIPHRDINGNLIGIRGRSYNPIEVADGRKYMPVSIENEMYKHPLGKNLFGLYQNKETIKKLKKVLICESEKAVMQAASFYGIDNCFVVATCGSSLSQAQIELIMNLGVEDVILGYDKEFTGIRGDEDEVEYENKLLKIIQPLSQYFNTYLIMDFDNLLGYKDSPTDKGKEILEQLMKKKIYIPPIQQCSLKRGK